MVHKTEIAGISNFVELDGMLYGIFEDVLRLFIHCYNEIMQNEIFQKDNMDGKYEDFYRNKLILDYLNKNAEYFRLDNLEFIPGSDEIDPNTYISKGNPDIKIININFLLSTEFQSNRNLYFTFECKRFGDNATSKSYVDHGIQRFVETKQSGFKYSHNLPFAGMIGFIEEGNPDDIITEINKILKNHKDVVTEKELTKETIDVHFNFSYYSIHERNNSKILLHHLMYDYTTIVQ